MQRIARGLDVPLGTVGQETAAMKCFDGFLALVGMDEGVLGGINKAFSSGGPAPSQNLYSLLTAFSIFLQTKASARASLLAKATAVGYMSQVANPLRERYPMHMIDNKKISKIREKIASAIGERDLLANVQTRDAPGWSPEPSSYVFPLVPRIAVSDLPGGQTYSQDETILFWENLDAKEEAGAQQPAKVWTRPSVSKYINDLIAQSPQHFSADPATQSLTHTSDSAEPLPALTAGLSSHSLCRDAATYVNASSKLAIQWISTRGAWLLDSLTKAFAYVGTVTREDQSVDKVFAGFKNPDLPCFTPSIRMLRHRLPDLENATGFNDTLLNVAPDVLDAALTSLQINLEEVVAAVSKGRDATWFTSYYIYRFHEAIGATNSALGSRLSMATCIEWSRQMKAAWKTDNFAQIGASSGGKSAAITQILVSIGSIAHCLWKQTIWTLAEDIDRAANDKLHRLDGKRRIKTAESLHKRWNRLRADSRLQYDVLCSVFLALYSSGSIVDECTPATHLWTS